LASASAHPHWWAGDVWKALLILKKFRSDLAVHVFDAFPTGLAVITGLDPSSTVLADRYTDIVASHRPLTLGKYGVEKLMRDLDTRPSTGFADMLAMLDPVGV
jgi:hypothetical protein